MKRTTIDAAHSRDLDEASKLESENRILFATCAANDLLEELDRRSFGTQRLDWQPPSQEEE